MKPRFAPWVAALLLIGCGGGEKAGDLPWSDPEDGAPRKATACMLQDLEGRPFRCSTYDPSTTDLDPSAIVYCPKEFGTNMEGVRVESCPENEKLVGICSAVTEGVRLFAYYYASDDDFDDVAAHWSEQCANGRGTWHAREG